MDPGRQSGRLSLLASKLLTVFHLDHLILSCALPIFSKGHSDFSSCERLSFSHQEVFSVQPSSSDTSLDAMHRHGQKFFIQGAILNALSTMSDSFRVLSLKRTILVTKLVSCK